MSVQHNLAALAGAIPAPCTLVAVSKTQPPEKIKEAYDWGQRDFGENRAQELAHKHKVLPDDITWHMIGHLQTNKVKYIAPFVALIHSVDRPKLLEEINRQAAKAGRIIPCLLQVHIAEEESKFGFSADELAVFLAADGWHNLHNVAIEGLMGMATFTDDETQIRKEFRGLKQLFEQLKSQKLPTNVCMKTLSMGMSADFRIAIEEGSTLVRVGSAIFGQRS